MSITVGNDLLSSYSNDTSSAAICKDFFLLLEGLGSLAVRASLLLFTCQAQDIPIAAENWEERGLIEGEDYSRCGDSFPRPVILSPAGIPRTRYQPQG